MSLASRGLRDMGAGPEAIEDDIELAVVRAQARRVRRNALILATAITAVAVGI